MNFCIASTIGWDVEVRCTYEVCMFGCNQAKLEEMAKSLIMAKYGVGYDYFM